MGQILIYIKRHIEDNWFHMETNRLKQFCTVVETGNLRKAADLLAISHSGLSKSMKVLETELGFGLFNRSGRGIVISDQGMKLYEKASDFFIELQQLLDHREIKSRPNIVRIGSFEVFTSDFIGYLVKDYLQPAEIEIHELVPGRLEEALAFNKVDIGITYEPIPRKGIEYVKVTSLYMGVFVVRGAFRGQDYNEIPFVVPVNPLEGAPSGVKGRDGWPDEKYQRNIRYRVDLMATGLALTRQGLCGIFIPKFVAELHNKSVSHDLQLIAIDLPKNLASVRRDVYIVKRESTTETRAIQQIAKALRKIC
jgi:DNA-binding transcriptional LysR family regulator